ncbi:RNA binding S1 domain protein [Deinococcus proteolyticus MRP]|uniref:Small ribosomal subunit protein bS1 n=1 Tax=Deinococcus proteolyticus (strain ATCC 35074 / DSM 20540 / JCM 6276 / NBRC 101906 / NCIMB 13154 / VKM Ac-1939 / CCM 2703 / MRP) TaxID=693977 RepID=F0RJL2_DEIPM|nr:30S ribosomal protein S1 [Deinococcus proteolyticus]ADY26582.1 RNA binding S1 domain protein [Deinococcus proteolyticus MRP]
MEDKTQTPAQEGGMIQPDQGTETATQSDVQQEQAQPAQPQAAQTEERDYPEMTMEDVLASEAQEPQNVNRGDIVDGTVVFIGSEGIAVDIGAKVEGIVPLTQLGDEPMTAEEAQAQYKPGDSITTYVVRVDTNTGQIVLSKKRADQNKGWRVLEKMQEEGQTFEVEVLEKVRGGLVAQVEGIRAFLPASQVDTRRVNDLDPYVGKPLQVQLIELNRKRNRVIISHRSILDAQKEQAKQETMTHLESGAEFEGTVVEITDFGVFVNLGGIDGLVHRSELTYGRFNHPREVVAVGDKVKVQVIDVDESRERINLSMKSLTNDPWEGAMERYSIGQRVKGKVTNLTNFGAFVELEPGLEGLVHVSEMSWTKRVRHPNEVLTEGEEAEAVILRMDPVERRISLGIRQTTDDPWSALPDRYPPGTPVKGQVTGLTDFGVFMEIEEGIEGLIHISELDIQRVNNPADLFKKGDEIEAVILNIDPVEQRASLSRRRALGGGPAPREGGNRDFVSQGGGSRTDRYSGGNSRGGRGGGRGADYNYSAKDASQGGKISTKLGDVYADLFAQFGMSSDSADKADTSKAAEKTAGIPDAQSPEMSAGEAVALTEGYDNETQS